MSQSNVAAELATGPPGSLEAMRPKLIAAGIFFGAAFLLYYLFGLPVAVDVEDYNPWVARAGKELVIAGAPPGQFLRIEGPSFNARFERANIDRETRDALSASARSSSGADRSRLEAAAAVREEGRVDWLAGGGGDSKAVVDIKLERAAADAEITVAQTGADTIPELRVRAEGATLSVALGVTAGDGGTMPPTGFSIARREVPQPWATMLPVRLTVPSGATFNIRFASTEALRSSFVRLGNPQRESEYGSTLAIRRLGVRRPRREYSEYACGASEGRLLFTMTPDFDDCILDAEDGVVATRMAIAPDGVAIELAGSGYVLDKGALVASDIFRKIADNKIFAALLALAFAVLARWVWRSLFGEAKAE